MRRRLANRILDREERWQWVPKFALRWAFEHIFASGTPVVFGVRSHPLIEINPAAKTWGTGGATVVTFPLSPDNPYR